MLDEIQHEQVLAGISLTLQQVHQERLSQLRKWGHQDHDPAMWSAILGEEVGEVCKEIAEGRIKPFDKEKYRKELIQVAAVASAAAQSICDGVA